MTTGAGTSSNTTEAPRPIDLLAGELTALFSDDEDELRYALAIGAQLAQRPPFLLESWIEFIHHMNRRQKRFTELHGAEGLSVADRRALEPRLPSRRRAYILVIGAMLIWMDVPSLRVGKLMADGRVFGVGQKWLREVTGIGKRRIRRVIADLVDAGYLTWTQPIARYVKAGAPGGVGHAAWNAIYRFEVKFFERIHRDKKLKAQRRRLAERRKERARVYAASLLRARASWKRARAQLHRQLMAPPAVPPRPPRPKP